MNPALFYAQRQTYNTFMQTVEPCKKQTKIPSVTT